MAKKGIGRIPRFRQRHRGKKTYFYYDAGGKPRKEIPLGSDYGEAIIKYAELEQTRDANETVRKVITFRYVAEKYLVDVVPTKAPTTQKDNHRELKNLLLFFDDPPAPIDAIEPQHVHQYLYWRRSAPVRANREKALLSHIWNYARQMGYTALANPCSGIKGSKETGRDVYIEEDLFDAVYEAASDGLKDAMDLFYLAGQRIADTLKISEADIRKTESGEELWVDQGKTKAKRRIVITGELKALIERIRTRKEKIGSTSSMLIVAEDGTRMTYSKLRDRFDKARELAGVEKHLFQMRDLRAKAATDKAESSGDIVQVRDQLGHTTAAMTEHYIRNRKGKKVTPTR